VPAGRDVSQAFDVLYYVIALELVSESHGVPLALISLDEVTC